MTWIVQVPMVMVGLILVFLIYRQFKMNGLFKQFQNQIHEITQQCERETREKNKISAELADTQTRLSNTHSMDTLTQLPTRQVLEDRLTQTIHQSRRYELVFAVIVLDIDELKTIENILGVEIAEYLILEIVERLKSCIRTVDTLSRFPNDKFVMIMPQLTKAETVTFIAQRIIEAVSEPCHIREHELYVTINMGVAIYPMDGTEGQLLIKNAETALYQAKTRGRNCFQFYQKEMHVSSRRELMLNSRLRSSHIYDEFMLYYQPIVNMKTKKITSMEALIRWMHPDFGLISPMEFLQLAVNNGRIVAIGEWVLLHACQQYKKWQDEGFYPDHVSVNVSLRQLESPQFVHKVSQILQETKMQAHDLVLEISESVLFPKMEMVEKTLLMLRHLGVQIAIDDFGTGYLSLQHLRRFPVDYLKIDGTLVRDIATDRESEQIVKMIIALADSLQLSAIAEAVESTTQRKMLETLGCSMMQGHLFSAALPPEEFNAALMKNIHDKV